MRCARLIAAAQNADSDVIAERQVRSNWIERLGHVKRVYAGLKHLSQIEVETDVPDRPGVTRQLLFQDEETGSKTRILTFPPKYRSLRSRENDGLMESHRSSEEIFVLDGVMSFGRWYDIVALGYAFHPPGWIHPADQQTEFGFRMLIKSGSDPVDFTFTPPPPNWDGQEFSLLGMSNGGSRGVTRRAVLCASTLPVQLADGTETGLSYRSLLRDGPGGWSTGVLTIPVGWRGADHPFDVRLAGLEFFVLAGDLTCLVERQFVELTEGTYYCSPADVSVRGTSAFSRNGCTIICWTRAPR